MQSQENDLIIIGAGPAGLTAALYAGRYRLKTVLFEKFAPGGQIVVSPWIDNYPGFPGGIATGELIEHFKKQTEEVGIVIESKEALRIETLAGSGKPLYRILTEEAQYDSKSIIIATGAQSKRLSVKGEELVGRGVSYCGTCDAPLFKNKEIVVVGGGDRAVEEALYLSTYASRVTVVHRRDSMRASKILEEKAKANTKINFLLNSVVEEIKGKTRVESVAIRNILTSAVSDFICQGVFIFIGIEPVTAVFKDLIDMDKGGFIITNDAMQTSREGVFACGDCRKKTLYQVINACGEGAVAAHSAHGYLLNR